MGRSAGRRGFRRHAARTLAVSGVALAGASIIGDRTGFGWISGPAAVGSLGALLLSFALFSDLPAASEGDTGNHVPHVSRNTDGD